MDAVPGNGLTITGKEELVPPPQAFVPLTDTFPEDAEEEKSIFTALELFPKEMLAPVGNVQLYPFALLMVDTEKGTPDSPWQTLRSPDIPPGALGKGSTTRFKMGE